MEERLNFSQRMGLVPARKPIQIGSIDIELRNTLWNLLQIHYWDRFITRGLHNTAPYQLVRNRESLFRKLWLEHFKEPIDDIPISIYTDGIDVSEALKIIKDRYLKANWNNVYELVEFICINGPEDYQGDFINQCNHYLEKENSGYRFVDGIIIEISSSEEISEIEKAIETSTPYYGVKQHLKTAITLLSDRENPDYRNSIKESISAVEALCKRITSDEKATLGQAIKFLEHKGSVHPALKKAFSSLYGYTSKADGIRHALVEEPNLTGTDARFMLISCSAFINYVIARIN